MRSDDGAGVGGDSGPELGALLGNGTGYSGALHFTLGVDNDTCIVFEVQEVSFSSAEGLSLAHEDGRHHLLPKIGLALTDGAQEHVADRAAGEAVQAATGHGHGDHEECLGASVVSAVDDCSGGETSGDLQLGATTSSLSYTSQASELTSLAHTCFLN